MGEFFLGWRRKIGLLTLLMACLFMGMWVRSRTTEDMMRISIDGITAHLVCSYPEGICWQSFRKLNRATPADIGFADWVHFYHETWDSKYRTGFFSDASRIITRVEWGGFIIGQTVHDSPSDDPSESAIWSVPYWSLVLPLGFISLWLLLSKSRKSTQEKVSEPINAVGA